MFLQCLNRILVPALCFATVAWAEQPNIDFRADVQPILAEKCLACHGPDENKRKAGLRLDTQEGLFAELDSGFRAVVSGDSEKSALVQRITTPDVDEQMPPRDFPKTLTASEKAILTQWVDDGAAWSRHWSFEPISKPMVPELDSDWVRNPIDQFILEAQQQRGLKPAPEADKRTLIRRLYFDLHGLPPTPEAVQNFLADTRPDAYERLVDELLSSPRYGERWGRHWLDVAHYADTHGYDKDKRRPNSWPYRDYVIEALNADKPWGQFIREQIAGDVLYPEDPQATVATGFIAAGPWDFVGHVELREGTKDKKIARYLDRDDMVTSSIMSFMSLTVNCARCHDHKFDPITQADYYGLQAVFAGVERANRSFDSDPEIHQQRQALEKERYQLEAQKTALDQKLAAVKSPDIDALRVSLGAVQAEVKKLDVSGSPTNGYHSAIVQEQNTTKWVQVDLGDAHSIETIRLVPAHPTDFVDTPGFGFPIRYRVEVSDESDFSNAETIADYTEQDNDRRTDHTVVFDGLSVEGRYVRVTATRLFKRLEDYIFALSELEVVSDGKNLAQGKAITALDSIESGRWSTAHLVDGYSSRNKLSNQVKVPTDELLKALKGRQARLEREEREMRLAALPEAEQESLTTTRKALTQVMRELRKLPEAQQVYAAANTFKREGNFTPAPEGLREVHQLSRGDVTQAMSPAQPGGIASITGPSVQFALAEEHDEGARRAALAQWISDEANPLTWRSVVNRVLQYHFGQAIVDTPNDFGLMGTPPTHPELLDWLAASFVEEGQSLKALHKRIVTSATWRQAVQHNEAYAQIDASNQYLWRMNRRQLEAEALRDAVLAVSGKLNLDMGGPGFDAFVFEDDHSPRYLYAQHDPTQDSAFRRSVYRFIVRSVPDPFMTTLDCADPSQSVPVRNNTITALQALSLYNNPLVVQQAVYLAERLEAEANTLASQVAALYQYALSRECSDEELKITVAFAQEHGLAAACRVLLNSNEFMFVD